MSVNSPRQEQVLALRSQGQSFGGIARELAFDNAAAAYDAYQEALRNAPEQQRASLQLRELERLDRLADRLREQWRSGEPNAEGKLLAIARLRAVELAEWIDRVAELPTGTIDPSESAPM